MKRILFLKSASTPLIVRYGVVEENDIVIKDEIEKELTKDFQPSTNLFNEIDTLLQKNAVGYEMIDEIYVASGPGSYTGARLLVTLVKTIALVYPQIRIFDASILKIFEQQSTNKNIDINIPLVSVAYARKNKYYFSKKVAGLEIKDTIYSTEEVLDNLKTACYVNGDYFENGVTEIANIPNKICSIAWYQVSNEVLDKMLYEPYYLEGVKIG